MPLRATFEMRDVSFSYPGAEEPVSTTSRSRSIPASRSRWWAAPVRARRRSSASVPRLYDATGGSVLVNGVDVRAVDPETLWSHIGLVPQQPYLFSGTVASNLRFGREEATDDELWEALEVAQARRLRRRDARRARRADRAGRHQRLGRAASASRHRPALVKQARHLPLRRLLLRARPRDRRPSARRARTGGGRRRGGHRGAAHLHHHQVPIRSS